MTITTTTHGDTIIRDARTATITRKGAWYTVSVSWSVYAGDVARFLTLKEAVKFARGRARVTEAAVIIH